MSTRNIDGPKIHNKRCFSLHMSFRTMSDHMQRPFLKENIVRKKPLAGGLAHPSPGHFFLSLRDLPPVPSHTVVSFHRRLDKTLDAGVVDDLIVTSGQGMIYINYPI